MKKQELAKRLAQRSGVSAAEAADQLDSVVHQILAGLRQGKSVPLPGLGLFKPGPTWDFEFEKAPQRKGGRHGR